MKISEKREKIIINKFQSLLRSGKDYTNDYMYNEAANMVFMHAQSARRIINRFYQGVINHEMIDFVNKAKGKHIEKVNAFSDRFNVCERESRLIIRYIKRMK